MSNPLTLHVLPGYYSGFSFSWAVGGGLPDLGPWFFTIEESQGTGDTFVPISPRLKDTYHWADSVRRIPEKDANLSYRVRLETASDVYTSHPVGPWLDIKRRDYLLIKDVMRREVLHARTLGGTTSALWVKNIFGPRCTVCLDPVTNSVRNSKCPVCMGTGFAPPYHGPYQMWTSFSVSNAQLEFTEDGSGTNQDKPLSVRMIGSVGIRKGDVVVDSANDKHYMVMSSQDLAELRRIPVVQDLAVSEMPTTDIAYKLTGGAE